MWVFGYGSLMWDGWEKNRGCLRRSTAELKGYVRIFNKLSVSNWGSKADPGPTLNLVAGAGSCRGVAFEFDEADRAGIVAYLEEREGKGFPLKELTIALDGEEDVETLVPLYQGRNVLAPTGIAEIAAMVLKAKGTSGSCASYIEGVVEHLRKLGINDPAVADLRAALVKARAPRPI
jgi:glutathione-specific gamma-glutamylcyclotransferase